MTPIIGITASSITASTLGDFEPIATVVVGSGGSTTISFTSIPSTYKHLQIRAIGRTLTAGVSDNAIHIQFNSDTGSNYSYHGLFGNGGSAFAYAGTSVASGQISQLPTDGRTASCFGVSVTDILDYADTSKYTTTRSLCGNSTNDTNGLIGIISASWRNTAAVTSITLITPAAGTATFAQYSHFALYGIK